MKRKAKTMKSQAARNNSDKEILFTRVTKDSKEFVRHVANAQAGTASLSLALDQIIQAVKKHPKVLNVLR